MSKKAIIPVHIPTVEEIEARVKSFNSGISDTDYEAYCKENDVPPEEFTTMELLAIASSTMIPNGASMFIGTGLPVLTMTLAQHTINSEAIIVMEAGMLDPHFEHIPVSVADIRGAYMASTALSMMDSFGTYEQRGYVTGGGLGGAEYDEYGNINATGLWEAPRNQWTSIASGTGKGPNVIFTGSGGSNPIGTQSDFILSVMVQEKRRFPYNVQFKTTLGAARGPEGESRWDYGVPRGGKGLMVSDLCIMENFPEEGIYDMRLRSVHPDVSLKDVIDNVMWELKDKSGKVLKPTDDVPTTPSPSHEQLKVLRMIVDPTRIYLKRKTVREVAYEKEHGKPWRVKVKG